MDTYTVRQILARHERIGRENGDLERLEFKQRVFTIRAQRSEKIRNIIAARKVRQVRERLRKEQFPSIQKMVNAIREVATKKQRIRDILDDQKIELTTQSVVKNSAFGIRKVAIEQIKVSQIDEISDDSLVYALLIFLVNPKDKSKANRKLKEHLQAIYTEELQARGIDPSKENLQRYMQELPEERRKKIFKQ